MSCPLLYDLHWFFERMSSYKTCTVPTCKSTTIKNPDKLFIHTPKCVKRRTQWMKLARRNPDLISKNSTIYFCEDHFDLPNDMDNYMEYHIMGSVSQIRMKPGCIPSKFSCQPNRRKQKFDTTTEQHVKNQKKLLIEECEKETVEKKNVNIHPLEFEETSCGSSGTCDKEEHVNHDRNQDALEDLRLSDQSHFKDSCSQTIFELKRKIKEDFDLLNSQDDGILGKIHVEIKQEDLEEAEASILNLFDSCSRTNNACGSLAIESHIELLKNSVTVTKVKEEPGSPLSDVSIHLDMVDSPEKEVIEIKLRKKMEMLKENEEILERLCEEISIFRKKHRELLADILYLQNVSKNTNPLS